MDIATLEGQTDLRQFLQVVRPDWATARRGRSTEIQRVVQKLQEIGVTSTWELVSRAQANRINEDLTNAGFSRFSRDTLESIKKQSSFVRALENLNEANYRQAGLFAPVPQLLSRKNLRVQAGGNGRPSSSLSSIRRTGGDGPGAITAFALGHLARTPAQMRRRNRASTPPRGLETVGIGAAGNDSSSDSSSDVAPCRPLCLRGYRGVISGTAGPRLGISRSLTSLPSQQASSTKVTGELLLAASSGSSGSRSKADLAELQQVAIQVAAGGTGSAAVDEAYERLARMGEEELMSLNHADSFKSQGGSDAQVLRISALYAKLGLPVKMVARTLCSEKHTVGEARLKLDSMAVGSIQQAGSAMALENRAARWSGYGLPPEAVLNGGRPVDPASRGAKGPDLSGGRATLRHAERMLKEQEALKEKARLIKYMDLEGLVSPMRHHVAANIRERMRDEKDAEAERMEMEHKCANIRRQISLMGNAKRDLNTLRRGIEADEKHMEVIHWMANAGAAR